MNQVPVSSHADVSARRTAARVVLVAALLTFTSSCVAVPPQHQEVSMYSSANGLVLQITQVGRDVDVGLVDAGSVRHEACSEPRRSICVTGPWINFDFPLVESNRLPTKEGLVGDDWSRGESTFNVQFLTTVRSDNLEERLYVVSRTLRGRSGCEDSYLISTTRGLIAFELCSVVSTGTEAERESLAPTHRAFESYFLISGRGLGASSMSDGIQSAQKKPVRSR